MEMPSTTVSPSEIIPSLLSAFNYRQVIASPLVFLPRCKILRHKLNSTHQRSNSTHLLPTTMSKWWRTVVVALRKAVDTTRSFHTIQAVPREITGNRVSVEDKAHCRIPAVVFAQPNPSTDDGGTLARSVCRKHLLTTLTEKRQIQSILKSIELPYFCSATGSSMLLESGNVLPIKV